MLVFSYARPLNHSILYILYFLVYFFLSWFIIVKTWNSICLEMQENNIFFLICYSFLKFILIILLFICFFFPSKNETWEACYFSFYSPFVNIRVIIIVRILLLFFFSSFSLSRLSPLSPQPLVSYTNTYIY